MGDPLSVAAGVIGVLTAAVQVSWLLNSFIRRAKGAPRQAKAVLTEVEHVHSAIVHLHPFLLGLESPDASRTCLLQVDSVLAILTGCVATFSELEEVIDQLKAKELGFLDRTKWISKESIIASLISRLQAHKLSLSLMLNILNGTTLQEVKTSVDRLDTTVKDNYHTILERLRSLESGHISLSPGSSFIKAPAMQQSSDVKRTSDRRVSLPSFKLPFEKELAITRVYRKINFNASTGSLFTTEDPKSSWSMISDLSVPDIASTISVYNLAITFAQLYNAEQYTSFVVEKNSAVTAIQHTGRTPHRDLEVDFRRTSESAGLFYTTKQSRSYSKITTNQIIYVALINLGLTRLQDLRSVTFRLYLIPYLKLLQTMA
ncbi:MAG: hypothetical protein Q9218_007522, partial [Villophora microphyllina]